MPVSDSVNVAKRVNGLKLRAAQRYNISPEKCHMGHIVLEAMYERPNRVHQIEVTTGISETNASVLTRSCRLASAMANYGLKVGDSVVLIGPNHKDLVVPFYACHYNGYPVGPLDFSFPVDDLRRLLDNMKPKMIFCLQSQADKFKECLTSLNINVPIVLYDGESTNMDTFISDNRGTDVNFRPAVFDLVKTTAWLILTSGTTGTPKVGIVPYETVINAIRCWWAPLTEKIEVLFAMGSIQWMSSLLHFISTPIGDCTRIQIGTAIEPKILVHAINTYKPQATVWTPYILSRFLEATWNVCDLSCFKYVYIGGSSVEKHLVDKLAQKCSASMYVVYGMSELMVPVFEFCPDTPFGSSGKPLEKFHYKIVKDDGSLAKTNETGELWIQGDEFFKGYLNNPEETKTVLTDDGWIMTGDIFYHDEKNFYYFVERKRLLIRFQRIFVSPIQLEDVIRSHPGVSDVCVVGIPDVMNMELPIAAIVPKAGVEVNPEEIFELLKKELPPLKQLHGGLFFMESLPVTPSGKIHRAKTKEIAFVTKRIMPNQKDVGIL